MFLSKQNTWNKKLAYIQWHKLDSGFDISVTSPMERCTVNIEWNLFFGNDEKLWAIMNYIAVIRTEWTT